MTNLSDRLKQLRIGRHLTQQQLADNLGVAKSTISLYESGQRRPSYEQLEAIGDYFNVDTNYLLGKENVSMRLLTAEELDLIDAYRNLPDSSKDMVCRMLSIERNMK